MLGVSDALTVAEPTTSVMLVTRCQVAADHGDIPVTSQQSAGHRVTADQAWHWSSVTRVSSQLRPERGCWSLQSLTAAAEAEASDQPTSECTAVRIKTTSKCSSAQKLRRRCRPEKRSSQYSPPCLRQIFQSSQVRKRCLIWTFWYWF